MTCSAGSCSQSLQTSNGKSSKTWCHCQRNEYMNRRLHLFFAACPELSRQRAVWTGVTQQGDDSLEKMGKLGHKTSFEEIPEMPIRGLLRSMYEHSVGHCSPRQYQWWANEASVLGNSLAPQALFLPTLTDKTDNRGHYWVSNSAKSFLFFLFL